LEFNDYPAGSNGAFQLKYEKHVLGVLSHGNNQWTFKYSHEFRKGTVLNPILGKIVIRITQELILRSSLIAHFVISGQFKF